MKLSKNPHNNSSLGTKWLLLGATVISLLTILEDYTAYLVNDFNYAYSWFSVPAKTFTNNFSWLIFVPFMIGWAKQMQSSGKRNSTLWIKAIMISILSSVFHRAISILFYDALYFIYSGFWATPNSPKNVELFFAGTFTSIIQYWIIMVLLMALVYYRQYILKQKELNEAQLRALKMQLHPHFLFNTLNSVASLIDIDPKAAQKMVTRLGRLMRNTLEHERKQSATLAEEIDYIKNYLGIEHVRFQDRLEIHYDIEEAALNASLPYMILQPIIENAIKHGIKDVESGGQISLSANVVNERVVITILDNGSGVSTNKSGTGVGLSNVMKRLKRFYEEDVEFISGVAGNTGFQVKMNIPYQKSSIA